jgi:hypothetical protein
MIIHRVMALEQRLQIMSLKDLLSPTVHSMHLQHIKHRSSVSVQFKIMITELSFSLA